MSSNNSIACAQICRFAVFSQNSRKFACSIGGFLGSFSIAQVLLLTTNEYPCIAEDPSDLVCDILKEW